jgi:hypothetical protein
MVNLTFTGIAGKDPDIRVTETKNTIATFPVDVKDQPHLPPTRILVVAAGKQAAYAQWAIKEGSLVTVGGWFCLQKNAKGIECLEVRAKHLRALIV